MSSNTRQKMIETTARLVQAKGYHGTSLNDILRESDAPRGSLYFHFPGGKKTLVLEAMRAGIEELSETVKSSMENSENPAEGVMSNYQILAQAMKESNYRLGCPVSSVVLDMPEIGSELAETCREAYNKWNEIYFDAFVDAGIESGRAMRLAKAVQAASEGAILMARSEQSTQPIKDIGKEMAEMISNVLNPKLPLK
jgi:TetR/AcrR family transcriptional regulator, lmrAB and yxaGH operons repressor